MSQNSELCSIHSTFTGYLYARQWLAAGDTKINNARSLPSKELIFHWKKTAKKIRQLNTILFGKDYNSRVVLNKK